MATIVKTAISIQKSLFDQAESLAQQLNVSRSRLFGLAIEDFIKHHQSRLLLEEIDQAYADEPDTSEQIRLSQMRKSHRKIVEGEW